MSHVPILSTLFHHDTLPNFRMVITTVLMVEMIMNAKEELFYMANHKRCESLISLITFRAEVEIRGVASPQVCRSGPKNFWFDHSTTCNKLCVVGVS